MLEPTAIGTRRAKRGEDLNLLAGEWSFGRDAASVRTLLGSCVSITLWHPGKRLGGMCHYLLPRRAQRGDAPLDGRYGEEAFELLLRAIERSGTKPSEYRAGLYGGADTMPDKAGVKLNIGERNIELGWGLIEEHGLELIEVDVGDHVPRHVRLTLATGQIEMRRGPAHQAKPSAAARRAA